ncbi:MAG: signal peptidase I [Bacilli bacterium]|nr:signal peptidase I [Bacilli bacterium]
MKNELKEQSVFQKLKWWLNFITTIIMNSIIVILILIGIIFLLYYIDVVKNSTNGKWQPPLYQAYVIISQSMEPTIHVQDAIVTKRMDDYKIGDVCTYISKNPRYFGIMITHRIVGTDIDVNGEKVYKFKGDNNYSADDLEVSQNQIYGKVVMKIPKIGYIQYFLSSAYGWIIAIVIPCVGIITFDIIKLIKTSSNKRRRKR